MTVDVIAVGTHPILKGISKEVHHQLERRVGTHPNLKDISNEIKEKKKVLIVGSHPNLKGISNT